MLEAIKHIGELERSGASSEMETLVEDLATKKNYDHILLITFQISNGMVTSYLKTDLEEIDSSRKLKYLYRRGASMGADATPTSLITEPEKTIRTKLDAWIKKNAEHSNDPFLSSLARAYATSHQDIITDVARSYGQRGGKKGYALTLLFDDGGTSRYIGDYSCFRDPLMESAAAPGHVSHKDHVCSICGQQKPVIYGDIVPGKTLKFYTLDKPGYIANGFSEENSWKNFPVCQACAMELEAGTTYVDKHLNFALGGARYYLIPKLIVDDEAVLKRTLGEFQLHEKTLASTTENTETKATVQDKVEAIRKAESDSERAALRIMGKQSPAVSFDLLFYDKPQVGTFKILQHIQDVAPGRAALIDKAMRSTDQLPIFEEALPGRDGSRKSVFFSFWQLAQFFKKPDSKTDQTWKQEYLAVVADVFTGAPVGKDYILHQIMQKLHDELLD
ncbi:MAG: TM1802 family CRISPR-associated protein, partial [Halothiobacillaceae bacterium]